IMARGSQYNPIRDRRPWKLAHVSSFRGGKVTSSRTFPKTCLFRSGKGLVSSRGSRTMEHLRKRKGWLPAVAAALGLAFGRPPRARAGRVAWLDDVVEEGVREAGAGGRAAVRGSDATAVTAHAAGRLFVREADESLELVARRAEDLARAGGRVDRPA